MTVPEGTILLLALLLLVLASIRGWLWIREAGGKHTGSSRYETGASKTIGDREIQEDAYGIKGGRTGIMAVLADGMGKHFGGKIAGRIAVETFLEVFEDESAFYNPQYSFRRAFQGANREILKSLEEEQGCASVAAALIKDGRLYYASAGNVKVAVYRSRELVPVSSGHRICDLARRRYEEGRMTRQEAAALLENHRLYNYVGQEGFHDIEFFDEPIQLHGGEIILLMTDGLYETARWKDIEDCLEEAGSCQEKAFRLIELVNQSQEEHKDNGAVVVMRG